MDPTMQQYYYAQGAPPTGPPAYIAAPQGYYQPQMTGSQAGDGAYVMQPQQPASVVYYTTAPIPAPAGYYQPQPVYYQPPEAAFAAMSISNPQTVLPQPQMGMVSAQQSGLPQPAQTPGASSTTSNGSTSQPRAASTPIPSDEPATLGAPPGCNQAMIPMQVMHYGHPQMMPQYYQMAPYEQQHMQAMYEQQQQQSRMISTDPNAVVESLEDISQISHQSSPESFIEQQQPRVATTPVSSIRRRVSLPPSNQLQYIPALLPSNYKTRMCTQWLEKRACTMGTACKFAHGNEEIRLPERPFRAMNNPKYKTKMCKNFEPGASGLCAYADRCEYIHPTDREYLAYKQRAETLAKARGDYSRYRTLFDEVPGANSRRGGRGDEENKSVRSVTSDGNESARDSRSGYLGSALPPSVTRSAIRMGAGADRDHGHGQHGLRRSIAGGSMFNLASGTYGNGSSDRDEYKTRLSRVPSASNIASLGASLVGGGGPSNRRLGSSKFSRRASMCHLNAAEHFAPSDEY